LNAKRKNISLRYFDDNSIDGQRFFLNLVLISHCKKELPLKKKAEEKKHPNALMHFKKNG
jgi:hypothetical protein